MTGQYSAPRLYEIAFDTNRKLEVDFLVHCFKRYARIRVRRALDIACGTGPHLIRLADRGYAMSGLDLSSENIAFLRERLAAHGPPGELIVGDMTDFRLERPVDAAICMQDSQGHLLTNEQLLAHLRAVARAVRRGGLYGPPARQREGGRGAVRWSGGAPASPACRWRRPRAARGGSRSCRPRSARRGARGRRAALAGRRYSPTRGRAPTSRTRDRRDVSGAARAPGAVGAGGSRCPAPPRDRGRRRRS